MNNANHTLAAGAIVTYGSSGSCAFLSIFPFFWMVVGRDQFVDRHHQRQDDASARACRPISPTFFTRVNACRWCSGIRSRSPVLATVLTLVVLVAGRLRLRDVHARATAIGCIAAFC